MNNIDIISFGEPLFELSQQTQPSQAVTYLSGYGGDTSNFAVSASRQGARVAMLTHVGKDVFGDKFLDLWRAEGVNTDWVVQDIRAPTGLYFISYDEQGHHFSFYRTGSAASRITPDDISEAAIGGARLLHTSAITHAISPQTSDAVFAAIRIARQMNTLVSFDTNLRLKLWPLDRARAIIHETIRLVDYCLPSLDEARQLTGLYEADDIADYYLTLGAKNVVLKMGAEGAMFANAGQRFTCAGHRVDSVDATGAGDCFSGAFLTRILRGDDPEDALFYANCAAALTTTGYGAVAPIPRREEVEEFIRRQR